MKGFLASCVFRRSRVTVFGLPCAAGHAGEQQGDWSALHRALPSPARVSDMLPGAPPAGSASDPLFQNDIDEIDNVQCHLTMLELFFSGLNYGLFKHGPV
jgi:hypothetical protein